MSRLLKTAASRFEGDTHDPIARWFVDKYSIPTNDPRYLERTKADLVLEFLEDLHVRRRELRTAMKYADPRERFDMQKQFDAIAEVLQDGNAGQPAQGLLDFAGEVARAIEEGREPNI